MINPIRFLFSNMSSWLHTLKFSTNPINVFFIYIIWWMQFCFDIYAIFDLLLPKYFNIEVNTTVLKENCYITFWTAIVISIIYLLYNNKYHAIIEDSKDKHSIIMSTIISWFTSIIQFIGIIAMLSLSD